MRQYLKFAVKFWMGAFLIASPIAEGSGRARKKKSIGQDAQIGPVTRLPVAQL